MIRDPVGWQLPTNDERETKEIKNWVFSFTTGLSQCLQTVVCVVFIAELSSLCAGEAEEEDQRRSVGGGEHTRCR